MKSNLLTIILFTGSLIYFTLFSIDYIHNNKDFMTMIILLSSIVWWTCGLINFITDRIK